MRSIKNLKKYKLFLLLGSIFLIYMFSQKLFGAAEQKITSMSLERIQGDVKNKLFDVLSANELTTKPELDQYITTSQNILIELKDENQKTPEIAQPVTPKTVQPTPQGPESIPEPELEPTPKEPIFDPEPELMPEPIPFGPEPIPEPELEPIPGEPIFGTKPELMPESIPVGMEPTPEPMMEINQTPTTPEKIPPMPFGPEPIPAEQPIMEEQIETTGGTEIAEMIPPTPPMQEAMFPEVPEGMEP